MHSGTVGSGTARWQHTATCTGSKVGWSRVVRERVTSKEGGLHMATQRVDVDATENMDGRIPPWTTNLAAVPGRTDTLLSAPWRFLRDDRDDAEGADQPSFDDSAASWETISVPHTWNWLDGQDGGHGQVRGDYYRGVRSEERRVGEEGERGGVRAEWERVR